MKNQKIIAKEKGWKVLQESIKMKTVEMDPCRLAIKKTCKYAKVVNYRLCSDVICKKAGERIRNRKICLLK